MKHFLAIIQFFLVFMTDAAHADFTCAADVSFKWQQDAEQPPAPVKADEKSPPAPAATSQPEDSFWARVEVKGKDEAQSKGALGERVVAEQAAAMRECRKQHENLAGCIGSKYYAMGSVLNTLGFTARKNLEDAIRSDCEKRQGKCLGASAGEAKCQEIVKAVETPSPAPDEKKKDSKKKK